jgi:hypothetical protein
MPDVFLQKDFDRLTRKGVLLHMRHESRSAIIYRGSLSEFICEIRDSDSYRKWQKQESPLKIRCVNRIEFSPYHTYRINVI